MHLVLLLTALALLPITPGDAWKPHGDGNPTLQILVLLAASLGLPYFVLSATGPLIQHWFSRANPGVSPYRLYALSNVGSLLALVSYPFYFETRFTRIAQATLWGWGLLAYVLCCGLCAVRLWKVEGKVQDAETGSTQDTSRPAAPAPAPTPVATAFPTQPVEMKPASTVGRIMDRIGGRTDVAPAAPPRPATPVIPRDWSKMLGRVRADVERICNFLEALAKHGDKGHEPEGHAAASESSVEPAVELASHLACSAAHPEDHPGHERHGDDRHRARERGFGSVGEGVAGEGEDAREGERDTHRQTHAGPQCAHARAMARLDDVGHEDPHDERCLEPLAQTDQIVREHQCHPPVLRVT